MVDQKRYSWYLFLQTWFEGTFEARNIWGLKRETHSIPTLTHCTKHHLFSKRSMILSSTINLIPCQEHPARWWQLKYFLYFHPYFAEKIPILTFAYFSKGLVKKHQPVIPGQKHQDLLIFSSQHIFVVS